MGLEEQCNGMEATKRPHVHPLLLGRVILMIAGGARISPRTLACYQARSVEAWPTSLLTDDNIAYDIGAQRCSPIGIEV